MLTPGSLSGKAYIAGAFEHPTRLATDKTVAQLHVEVAQGALKDAGLGIGDVDAYFACDAPGLGPFGMVEHLGIRPAIVDSTDIGGSAPMLHVNHAVQAIAAGKCHVALITLAGRPRAEGQRIASQWFDGPEFFFEAPYKYNVVGMYALSAARHMHEFGTTSEQLAWIRVAASHHAQHNERALRREVVTVEDVVNPPMIADPLHRLDCCVVTDGGGALVVVSPEVAKSLSRPKVKIRGCGEAIRYNRDDGFDITTSAAAVCGAQAFAEAGIAPADIKCACIYDSFTISVLIALEDLGFCAKGQGGKFVSDGNLISGVGKLPFNTDGGGLCNNHPANRGGMTKIIEIVRQLRGEAHPRVQVPNCDLALAHGTGGWISTRHGSATVILERA
ncbi:MAG TPA: thiolase domain-containing protein [Rhizomicrobium sp.]